MTLPFFLPTATAKGGGIFSAIAIDMPDDAKIGLTL